MFTCARLLRVSTVWFVVSAAAVGLVLLAGPDAVRLLRGPGPAGAPFDRLLVECCSLVGLVGVGRLWWVTTDVALSALRRRPRRCHTGPLYRVMLAACGLLALSVGPAAAVGASSGDAGPEEPRDRPASLAGLPLPDRPTGGLDRPERGMPPRVRHTGPWLTVAPGDSLWTLAEQQLGERAGVVDVAAYWRRLCAANAERVAPDPDLIHPGLRLRRPPTRP